MNQTQLNLTEGQCLKEEGMALVSLYAEHQWQERFKAVARQVAAMGKPFTSEEILTHAGEPPGHRNVIGATMNSVVRELKLKAHRLLQGPPPIPSRCYRSDMAITLNYEN